jgi:hypothetical protein
MLRLGVIKQIGVIRHTQRQKEIAVGGTTGCYVRGANAPDNAHFSLTPIIGTLRKKVTILTKRAILVTKTVFNVFCMKNPLSNRTKVLNNSFWNDLDTIL